MIKKYNEFVNEAGKSYRPPTKTKTSLQNLISKIVTVENGYKKS